MSYQEHLAAARSALKTAQSALNDEIHTYPTPISGCDAQFNHLLGDRERVAAALDALMQSVFVPTPRTPTPGAGIEAR